MTRLAVAQFASTNDRTENARLFREAGAQARGRGARILAFPELSNSTYFCWRSDPKNFELAEPIPGPTTHLISEIAKEEKLAVICSVFEVDGREYFNTAFIVNAQGELIGRYRKTHIPLSVGDEGVQSNEKMYFRPGNIGLPVFDVADGLRVGILICFDRHFPEAARTLALRGADLIVVPTASWSDRARSTWELELRAHAKVNQVYVAGINKAGREAPEAPHGFYGSSVIVDPRGEVLIRAGEGEEVVAADLDLDGLRRQRFNWQVFRDRRPDLYVDLVR